MSICDQHLCQIGVFWCFWLVGRFGHRLARSWWWPRALKTTPVETKKASPSRCRWDGETFYLESGLKHLKLEIGYLWFNWRCHSQWGLSGCVVNYFPKLCWAQRGRCKVAGMISGLYWCFSGLQSLSFRSFRHSLTCWVRKEFVRWEKFVFKEIWTDQKWTCLNMPQKVWQGKNMFCVLSSIQLSR